MIISSDTFKSTLNSFSAKLSKLGNTLSKSTGKTPLSDLQLLRQEIVQTKVEVQKYKANFKNENYSELLSQDEYRRRIEKLEEVISELIKMENNVGKLNSSVSSYTPLNQETFPKDIETEYERSLYIEKMLQSQDKLIENMLDVNKNTKELGKKLGNELKIQTGFIDKIHSNMDTVTDKMEKTNKKFERYIGSNEGYCKLYLILVVETIILVYLLI